VCVTLKFYNLYFCPCIWKFGTSPKPFLFLSKNYKFCRMVKCTSLTISELFKPPLVPSLNYFKIQTKFGQMDLELHSLLPSSLQLDQRPSPSRPPLSLYTLFTLSLLFSLSLYGWTQRRGRNRRNLCQDFALPSLLPLHHPLLPTRG
jgi:hypothetical protein